MLKDYKWLFVILYFMNGIDVDVNGIDFSKLKPLQPIKYDKVLHQVGIIANISDLLFDAVYLLKKNSTKDFRQFELGGEVFWRYGIYSSASGGMATISVTSYHKENNHRKCKNDSTGGWFVNISLGKRFGNDDRFYLLRAFCGYSYLKHLKHTLDNNNWEKDDTTDYNTVFPYFGIAVRRQYKMFESHSFQLCINCELILKWPVGEKIADYINKKVGLTCGKYKILTSSGAGVPYFGYVYDGPGGSIKFLPGIEIRIALDVLYSTVAKQVVVRI